MAWDRIAALPPAQPFRAGSATRQPVAGEVLELTLDDAAGGEVAATTAEGLSLRLQGLGGMGRSLAAGDVLLMKVVTTSPRLELALFDTALRSGSTPAAFLEAQSPAMRVDQLALLRQVAGRPPDANSLAASWRSIMLDAVERRAARGPVPLAEVERPASAARSAWPMAVGSTGSALPSWLLATLTWGAPRLTLQALAVEDEDEQPQPQRRRFSLALQFELAVAEFGLVSVQLRSLAGGVAIDLAAERQEAMAPLRGAVPDIAAAVARADSRLVRCRLHLGLPGSGPFTGSARPVPPNFQASLTPVAAMSPGLFRAAAEVALILAAPWLLPDAPLGLSYR